MSLYQLNEPLEALLVRIVVGESTPENAVANAALAAEARDAVLADPQALLPDERLYGSADEELLGSIAQDATESTLARRESEDPDSQLAPTVDQALDSLLLGL